MAGYADGQEPPRKKAKLEAVVDIRTNSSSPLTSFATPITPPQRRARVIGEVTRSPHSIDQLYEAPNALTVVPSPFKLTTIRDLPTTLNTDTVTLKDLLGDPLIAECWEFNYLHDVDMLMEVFDPDIRDLVKVHIVHGFWKGEDGAALKTQALRYSNVTLHAAYMPEPFGTHHTKMMVLLRHDDLAQIIIHTANLIQKDWANMSQAVWRSPLLPLSPSKATPSIENSPVGSGSRFKIDFLNYLRAYDRQRTICKPLIDKLVKYDFSEIRGALVGSVPGRHSVDSDKETKWGWQALRHVLASVPTQNDGIPEVVAQVSSIATLGQTSQWLDKTLLKALGTTKRGLSKHIKYAIIFPTGDEIRRSLDGYQSGASIHIKIQTSAQAKQLQYLKPILHHWAGDGAQHSSDSSAQIFDAGRKRAAPHIKTYIRFGNASKTNIDWALVTSANISKQAWGDTCSSAGEVRICSYELGVLVWPELFGEDSKMVPTFKQDLPVLDKLDSRQSQVVVGFRMPYDLPLVPYSAEDVPWCASASYNESDWRGHSWN